MLKKTSPTENYTFALNSINGFFSDQKMRFKPRNKVGRRSPAAHLSYQEGVQTHRGGFESISVTHREARFKCAAGKSACQKGAEWRRQDGKGGDGWRRVDTID